MDSSARMRRCERCKTRKKKCDQSPSCSRCTRLGVECVRERFKFVPPKSSILTRHDDENLTTKPVYLVLNVPPRLNEKSDQLKLALIRMIENDNPRYNINLAVGLLEHIPRRLGLNLALDSAADALIHGYVAVNAGTPSLAAMESYALALRDLRTCFENSVLACKVETMCAIYLIISVQVLMGNQFAAVHGEGLAHILNARGFTPAEESDEFTSQLLVIMSGQIIFEAIVNPRIVVPAHVKQLLAKRDKAMPMHSIRLTQHAKLRDFISCPISHASEIASSYRITFSEIMILRERRRMLDPAVPYKDRAIFYIACSVALSYSIILNTILLRSGIGANQSLLIESEILLDEILSLTEAAAEFIPLGSSAMSTLLLAAWPNDPIRRPEIEQWLRIYECGFPIARWIETATWLDEMLPSPASAGDELECHRRSNRPADACVVM